MSFYPSSNVLPFSRRTDLPRRAQVDLIRLSLSGVPQTVSAIAHSCQLDEEVTLDILTRLAEGGACQSSGGSNPVFWTGGVA